MPNAFIMNRYDVSKNFHVARLKATIFNSIVLSM
jgi:hypothetical protein